ncbi:MAG: inorganic phosphate transporter [Acidobacteria bacterium]|nr:inorganic phosphate transporter [Acidobacteriota bacterium]MCA1632416.1 inorganic phosphate transporter [Acidobacteriota bacterium]MCA1640758.1 inorganic phosphate transporter [Acidobacteriota bacterium]
MTASFIFVLCLIALALVFDYINGFHDAANSIATVVSTRVLSPGVAVVWAAFFNFIAFAVYGTRVAKAIGDSVHMEKIEPELRLYVLLAALVGAIIWNLITWYLALPTSSSHALIGGYVGAGLVAYGGAGGVLNTAYLFRTITFIVLSPLIGALLGLGLMVAVSWVFRRWTPHHVDRLFRKGQLLSAAGFSLGHGGNDAQKTMGIMTAVLAAGGYISYGENGALPPIPLWVVLAAHAAIALGTLSGGWRIVHTMGTKITKLKPVGGFCAETGAALTLAYVTLTGTPVSTTHTITGAIVGVGATKRLSAVKWGVAGRILWAWVLTIPIAATIAGLSFLILRLALRLG